MSTATTSTPPGTGRTRTKWPVVLAVGAVTAVVALWALIAPERSEEVLGSVVGWTSEWFGWFYILLATVILVFVVYVGLRYGKVRLGRDDDRPEFSTFAWASMLFAAGIGTDVMFFAVAEPASQYLAPPQGEGGTLEAARESTVWTLFHYGITGWGMYALMGIALGFFAHRKGLPLAVRSALSPILGRRTKGAAGAAVDIATMLGTIFGIATSLGIGVVMLNVGLDILFGIPQGVPAQIGLVVLAVGVATVSAVTGVDRGIRVLSQLNVLLALLLAAWVLVTRDTAFLLRAAVMNVGDFVSLFPGMTMDTMAFDYDAEWMGGWTLFFWAWWIAWASFVGMFLARISKGRTIGQFVVGTLTIPFCYIVMWVTVFGNSAVQKIMDGDTGFGEAAVNTPEAGFFALLQDTPGALVLVALATFVGLLFYVTSADSGALVMANLSAELDDPDTDAAPWLRILWASATAVLTIAMLVVGGIPALQNATIIMGLPFAVVMVLVMWACTGRSRRSAS
ncbi:BCCT family transporter [Janibacter melonis]|uniref:BCCT family transporter n=1 Tax=Janibacter melonis TaxID=262209 RepID=UPI0020953718|nr:BCCT family transporter [Janibacter melonis]